MFETPTYISLADNESTSDSSPNSFYITNEPGASPSAIRPGWNGFQFQINQYSTDLKSGSFKISANNDIISSFNFSGAVDMSTTGIITSVTKEDSEGGSKSITSSIANVANKGAKAYWTKLFNLSSENKKTSRGEKLFNSFLTSAGDAVSSGLSSLVKSGLNAIFGRTSTKVYKTESDVNLSSSGDVTINGMSETTEISDVNPLSFNLYNILQAHEVNQFTSIPFQPSLTYGLITPPTLKNLGVWRLKNKPTIYWELAMPFTLNEPINFDGYDEQTFIGKSMGPKFLCCTTSPSDVEFNPAIAKYITSYNVTTELFNCKLKCKDYPVDKSSVHIDLNKILYTDSIKSLYEFDKNQHKYYMDILCDVSYSEVNPRTNYWFKWHTPQEYDTVLLVTVEMNISYSFNNFTIIDTRVYKVEHMEDPESASHTHNPPYEVILNHNPRFLSNSFYQIY